ncbi:MAG: DUF4905 domain-containing protein [Ignavibacteria bacterium]|nr:DUF4905 domain-containing protein [Ignavibacteria bacterium]
MSWLSRLKKNIVGRAWEYQTQGVLWRLIPAENGYFVGEDRDVDAKRVSFFCLDQRTGNVLWEGVQFGEPWWIGIEAVYHEKVFLHEYAAPDMPEHKKIYALDLRSGKTLWSNGEMKFIFAHDGRVYGSKDTLDRRVFFEVDAETGNIINEVDASYLNVLKEMIISKRRDVVEFPLVVDTMSVEVPNVKQDILRGVAVPKNLVQTEYLDKGDSLVVGFYNDLSSEAGKPDYEQHVVVVNKSTDKIVYRDTANIHAITPVPDTFFGISNFVYYIKNKQVLTAIKLTSTSDSNGKN